MDNANKRDYSIHIRTPSDESYQRIVEVLEPLGVEIIAGETDPLVMATFYLSRMNTKLDNLGQLRHLYKAVQHLAMLARTAESEKAYYDDLMKERRAHQIASLIYYRKKNPDPAVITNDIQYLSFDEIDKLFDS